MIYAAKLVWNDLLWKQVAGVARLSSGMPGLKNNKHYTYGYEEWLNNDEMVRKKIGYLDCYRDTKFEGVADKVVLFTLDPNSIIYHIGNIYTVRQLSEEEIPVIKKALDQSAWLSKVKKDFQVIGDTSSANVGQSYCTHYNSLHIVGKPETKPFILNIAYGEIELYEKRNWKNLTQTIPDVNNKWRRLSKRFDASMLKS
ncbi:hypothetical protein [uncultured Mucilaginibacter sp.]|uniref:hypothetical protein n=1 Tax=uncultured Mucilaginibacter sp. TaxID=797541 RepID=UPI0025D277C4|nr:hypothetical protein [uncultured Mucilaginibacter sp.]